MGPDERKRFEEWVRQQRADMEERRAVGDLRRICISRSSAGARNTGSPSPILVGAWR
jgi:hypothetical protein